MFLFYYKSGVPYRGLIVGNTFCDHGAASDFHIVPDANFSDYANVAAQVHIIADNRRAAETSIFQLLVADGGAMSQCAILSDYHLAVHYQGLSVK
jgi:hypothetical protein